ncbi:hypothetical protein TNCV_4428891 [Trichonephila clavipes]|nr:hypothetical protein TNCV_4428891 [Trichonephila clavipes]
MRLTRSSLPTSFINRAECTDPDLWGWRWEVLEMKPGFNIFQERGGRERVGDGKRLDIRRLSAPLKTSKRLLRRNRNANESLMKDGGTERKEHHNSMDEWSRRYSFTYCLFCNIVDRRRLSQSLLKDDSTDVLQRRPATLRLNQHFFFSLYALSVF